MTTTINKTQGSTEFLESFLTHVGHDIVLSSGDNPDNVVDVTLDCMTCGSMVTSARRLDVTQDMVTSMSNEVGSLVNELKTERAKGVR